MDPSRTRDLFSFERGIGFGLAVQREREEKRCLVGYWRRNVFEGMKVTKNHSAVRAKRQSRALASAPGNCK